MSNIKVALIMGNHVENVVVVEESNLTSFKAAYEANGYIVIANVSCGPGDTYEGGMNFSRPTAPPKQNVFKLSKLGFLTRFTNEELITIELLSSHNPNDTLLNKQQAATLRVIMNQFNSSLFIDVTDPRTAQGVNAIMDVLESTGVVNNKLDRINTILTTPATYHEEFRE